MLFWGLRPGIFDLGPELQQKQFPESNLNAPLERCENVICLGLRFKSAFDKAFLKIYI